MSQKDDNRGLDSSGAVSSLKRVALEAPHAKGPGFQWLLLWLP